MKEYTKIIIYVVILIAIIVFAKNQYGSLSEEQLINQIQTETTDEIQKENQSEIAPDFTVLNSEGNQVKLSDYFGTPIVINFWATWCGPCKSELPAFENLSKKYDGQVQFLMVNLTDGYTETKGDVEEFIKTNNYTFPVCFDTQGIAANNYNVSSIPETVFIDSDGNIVKTQIGAMTETILENYIQSLLLNSNTEIENITE